MGDWAKYFMYGLSNTVGDFEKPEFKWTVNATEWIQTHKNSNLSGEEGIIPNPNAKTAATIMIATGLIINYV